MKALKNWIASHIGKEARLAMEEARAAQEAASYEHLIAVAKLRRAEAQAHELGQMDRRNHYSESLELAYRLNGRTAQ